MVDELYAWYERQPEECRNQAEALDMWMYFFEYNLMCGRLPSPVLDEMRLALGQGFHFVKDPIGFPIEKSTPVFMLIWDILGYAVGLSNCRSKEDPVPMKKKRVSFDEAERKLQQGLRELFDYHQLPDMEVGSARIRSLVRSMFLPQPGCWGEEDRDRSAEAVVQKLYYWLYVERRCDEKPELARRLRVLFENDLPCRELLEDAQTTSAGAKRADRKRTLSWDIQVRDASILRQEGYRIELPEEQRRKLLLRTMKKSGSFEYPQMLLRFLIDSREANTEKDYSRAIAVWQSDLDYLQEVFETQAVAPRSGGVKRKTNQPPSQLSGCAWE